MSWSGEPWTSSARASGGVGNRHSALARQTVPSLHNLRHSQTPLVWLSEAAGVLLVQGIKRATAAPRMLGCPCGLLFRGDARSEARARPHMSQRMLLGLRDGEIMRSPDASTRNPNFEPFLEMANCCLKRHIALSAHRNFISLQGHHTPSCHGMQPSLLKDHSHHHRPRLARISACRCALRGAVVAKVTMLQRAQRCGDQPSQCSGQLLCLSERRVCMKCDRASGSVPRFHGALAHSNDDQQRVHSVSEFRCGQRGLFALLCDAAPRGRGRIQTCNTQA